MLAKQSRKLITYVKIKANIENFYPAIGLHKWVKTVAKRVNHLEIGVLPLSVLSGPRSPSWHLPPCRLLPLSLPMASPLFPPPLLTLGPVTVQHCGMNQWTKWRHLCACACGDQVVPKSDGHWDTPAMRTILIFYHRSFQADCHMDLPVYVAWFYPKGC